MKSLLIITVLLSCLYLVGFGAIEPRQDSLHQQRVTVVQHVLEAVRQGSLNTKTIFDEVFDQKLGSVTFDDKGYHDWLNLYLSQVVDTLSEEDVKKLSILDKRILSHRIYFQDLKERLKTVSTEDVRIFPYSTVKDPKIFDRGYIVHENDASDAYVITYPYRGVKKVEYVLFSGDSKIRSMAHIEESTGEVIGSFMFL